MKIRQIDIENFRGIKSMSWTIPKDRNLICLVGPGDSGKSSILDAIYLTLGDRWNPSIADTDFYGTDVSAPISIRCVVSDLSRNLLKESAFGLWLSGIDDTGKLYQDPVDGVEPALIVQLRIDETLEPIWTIEKMDGENNTNASSTQRREFATFKVDERTDVHLRWTRNSALGRISASLNSAGNLLALANRTARDAISCYDDENLNELSIQVQEKLNEVGCGPFCSIQAGLDTSLSSIGGNLALYESNVPLTNYGLGSKRLASLGVQQLAASGKSILLLDEIEHGLEPHRLIRLIQYIQSDQNYAQVFVTTHSPVAVEQASTDNIAIVQNKNGISSVKFLPEDGKTLKIRRSRPSSFLARNVIIVEGKTEEGIVLELIRREDERRLEDGGAIAASLGSVVQDGQGGSEVPLRAMVFHGLGYNVAMFLDNDDRTVDKNVAKAEKQGIKAVRWSVGNNTERQIVVSSKLPELSSLLELGITIRNNEQTVLNDLKAAGLPAEVTSIKISEWIDGGLVTDENARHIITKAMIDSSWFKLVDPAKMLGSWLLNNLDNFVDSTIKDTIDCLIASIYPDSDTPPITDGDVDAE